MKSKEIITFDRKRISLKYDKDLTCSWRKYSFLYHIIHKISLRQKEFNFPVKKKNSKKDFLI